MVKPSTFQTTFPQLNTRPFHMETKFHMEPPWDVGMKTCSNVPGHMTKMASRPICGKNLKKKKNSFGTKRLITLKLGIRHQVLKYYQIYTRDDTELTLTIFMTWSDLFS